MKAKIKLLGMVLAIVCGGFCVLVLILKKGSHCNVRIVFYFGKKIGEAIALQNYKTLFVLLCVD